MLVDTVLLDQIRMRFIELNQRKLHKTQEIMRKRQKDFLDVLPLLFHVNHASLPGFINKNVPFGVTAYSPSAEVIATTKKLFGTFAIEKKSEWYFNIHSIFLMGSSGTLAFSSKSDFDIWLCHRPGLKPEPLEFLQRKATIIEKWAEGLGLEVHFFLMNADTFRKGKILDLSSESSGSTQFKLLLDEFYRTSIWVAGRTPLWWLIPPEEEHNYEAIKKNIEDNKMVSAEEYIDFGAIPEIPTTELFGAGIWHIYKGIDSPYKSILKITAIEAYANDYQKGIPLCQEFKQMVHDNILDLELLDPYTMMLHRLERYLNNTQETSRIEIIRRCFYIKLDLPLSSTNLSHNWRTEAVKQLVAEWHWNDAQIALLDSRKDWKINHVIEERKLLVDHLTKSYSFLSNFARNNSESLMVKDQDIGVLGRKLFAAFDRKPGKIDIINRGIADNTEEDILSIIRAQGKDKSEQWLLYQGKISGAQAKDHSPIKRSRSLVEVLAWAYFNQVSGSRTGIIMHAPGSVLTNIELNSINDQIKKLSPNAKLPYASAEELLSTPKIVGSAVFINVGQIPNVTKTVSDKTIASGQTDMLKTGDPTNSFIISIEYIFFTTWHEIFVYKYNSLQGLIEWYCHSVRFSLEENPEIAPSLPELHSFSSHFGKTLANRIKDVLEDIYGHFFPAHEHINKRYILEAAGHIYVIYSEDKNIHWKQCQNIKSLLSFLEKPTATPCVSKTEQKTLTQTVIPLILNNDQANTIQIFVQNNEQLSDLYILDEYGSLFHIQSTKKDIASLLDHYIIFFNSILARQFQNLQPPEKQTSSARIELKIYQIQKQNLAYTLSELNSTDIHRSKHYYNVQVIGNVINKKTVFTLYCDEKEFSSEQHGDALFTQVCQHILEQRSNKEKYPIYITDLHLHPSLTQSKPNTFVPSIYFLRYKKRIENRLNQALNVL